MQVNFHLPFYLYSPIVNCFVYLGQLWPLFHSFCSQQVSNSVHEVEGMYMLTTWPSTWPLSMFSHENDAGKTFYNIRPWKSIRRSQNRRILKMLKWAFSGSRSFLFFEKWLIDILQFHSLAVSALPRQSRMQKIYF